MNLNTLIKKAKAEFENNFNSSLYFQHSVVWSFFEKWINKAYEKGRASILKELEDGGMIEVKS